MFCPFRGSVDYHLPVSVISSITPQFIWFDLRSMKVGFHCIFLSFFFNHCLLCAMSFQGNPQFLIFCSSKYNGTVLCLWFCRNGPQGLKKDDPHEDLQSLFTQSHFLIIDLRKWLYTADSHTFLNELGIMHDIHMKVLIWWVHLRIWIEFLV